MEPRKYWYVLSGALLLVAVVSLCVQGLNWGIDFTGGVMFDLHFDKPVTTSQLRSALGSLGLGESDITLDQKDAAVAIVRTRVIDEETRVKVIAAMTEKVGKLTSEEVHLVSPSIARDLINLAFLAVGIAFVGMLLYITYRFEFKAAVTAILALFHDAMLTVGLFSITQMPVTSTFVAAILTILGYSINDTIVIFDRVRENLKFRKKEGLYEVVNTAITQTLTRWTNTTVTTLLAIASVYVFGGRTTKDFALALIVGVACGAYSSVFVASPLWFDWKLREERRRGIVAQPLTAAGARAARGRVLAPAAGARAARGRVLGPAAAGAAAGGGATTGAVGARAGVARAAGGPAAQRAGGAKGKAGKGGKGGGKGKGGKKGGKGSRKRR
jgi:preprotein translocase subunit SecF